MRDGYTFKRWTTDKDGFDAYDFTTQVTSDMTLYAQWTKNPEPEPTKIEKPTMTPVTGLVYNGKRQTGMIVKESQYYTVSETSATNADSYTCTVSLNDKKNYVWEDGTTDDLTLDWMIAPKTVTITVHDASMIAGDPVPEFSGEVTGVVDGDDLMIGYFLDSQADTKKPGKYKIYAGWDVENPNYEVTSHNGTLTVSKDPAPQMLTVTFEANGGTLSGDAHQTVEKGKKATKPSNPTREGYSFDGWYTAPEGGDKYTFEETVEENLTLYAHWTKNVTVVPYPEVEETTFEYNGATQTLKVPASDYYAIDSSSVTSAKDAGLYKVKITLNEDCVWEDGTRVDCYIFWSITQKHATIDVDDATMVAGAEVPTFTGTVTGVCDGDDLQVAYKLADGADTTKAGKYKIQATFTDQQSNYIVAITEGTLTVTKAPEPTKTYQVIFNGNSGTIEGEAGMAVEVKAGECVEDPGTPVRDGYTFDGWYTAEEGGEKFDFATAITADTSLYAHWTKKAEPVGPVTPDPSDPSSPSSPSSDGKIPQTGDASAPVIAALGLAGVAIAGTGLALNKRKQ